jgi:hypothetical protein
MAQQWHPLFAMNAKVFRARIATPTRRTFK